MDDVADTAAGEEGLAEVGIAEIVFHQTDARLIFKEGGISPLHPRIVVVVEIVQNNDGMFGLVEQLPHQMAADKTRAAGNQNRHQSLPRIVGCMSASEMHA